VVWGTAILVLVGIYLLATVAFGLRFSNLTNRGIITSGPYRWVKHPAYLSKNLSWWLISVPFVAGAGWVVAVQSCALLVCVNLVYFLRAKTEERHLRADPAYRDYEAFIAEHGLVAVLRRAIGMRRRTEAPA
jgi:protein-S-isoprenylcysteine O-methyltransferase Ste14